MYNNFKSLPKKSSFLGYIRPLLNTGRFDLSHARRGRQEFQASSCVVIHGAKRQHAKSGSLLPGSTQRSQATATQRVITLPRNLLRLFCKDLVQYSTSLRVGSCLEELIPQSAIKPSVPDSVSSTPFHRERQQKGHFQQSMQLERCQHLSHLGICSADLTTLFEAIHASTEPASVSAWGWNAPAHLTDLERLLCDDTLVLRTQIRIVKAGL